MQYTTPSSYWIRQTQHTHASNPDTLKEREKKKDEEKKERKENSKTKDEKKKKVAVICSSSATTVRVPLLYVVMLNLCRRLINLLQELVAQRNNALTNSDNGRTWPGI